MDIKLLVKVCSRAWSLPILALLHSGVPGRQAPLLGGTNAGRTSFTASLKHLIQLELVERNPGYGHPLRPEFRLTASGRELAKVAGEIVTVAQEDDHSALLRKSWTVPILALTEGPRHFSELRTILDPITDRALSTALQNLESNNWMRRTADPKMRPVRPFYAATNGGLAISRIIRYNG